MVFQEDERELIVILDALKWRDPLPRLQVMEPLPVKATRASPITTASLLVNHLSETVRGSMKQFKSTQQV